MAIRYGATLGWYASCPEVTWTPLVSRMDRPRSAGALSRNGLIGMSRMRDTRGFTLIELLIVVLIIGVLAAIAIPQFTSTKERALDTAARSDLRNLMTAQESYFATNHVYVTVSVAAGGSASINGTNDFAASTGVALGATAATDGYSATAAHGATSTTWCVNTSPGATTPGKILKASSC